MATTTIQSLDGSGDFAAYRADPEGMPRGAIVVIQEVFGVNEGIRRKCDHWASKGYVTFAPDLFWRIEPGIQLDPDIPEQMERGLGLFGTFDQNKGIEDIEATIRAARVTIDTKVGVTGYCLGGRLAYMTAARTDSDASVGYYAVGVDGLLGEKHAIARPLLLHIAGNDGFVPPEVQAKMHDGLGNHPRVTLYDYPGEDHGFATEMGNRRSDAAAQLADSRTEAFFTEHIG